MIKEAFQLIFQADQILKNYLESFRKSISKNSIFKNV